MLHGWEVPFLFFVDNASTCVPSFRADVADCISVYQILPTFPERIMPAFLATIKSGHETLFGRPSEAGGALRHSGPESYEPGCGVLHLFPLPGDWQCCDGNCVPG